MAVAIDTWRDGPIRVAIEAEGRALEVLSTADRNRALKEALVGGGSMWLPVFGAARFTPYARRLGYHGDNPQPFVRTGQMRESVLGQGRVEAIARGGRAEIRIRVPYGHPLLDRYAAIFKTVPTWELERIASEVAAWLQGLSRQVQRVTPPGRARQRFRRVEGPVDLGRRVSVGQMRHAVAAISPMRRVA